MTQLEKIKQRYDKAKSNYLAKNPVLTPINTNKLYACGLCGKTNLIDISAHMAIHNQEVPTANNYFLSLPFEKVNSLIRNGKEFIKVLTFGEFAVNTEVTQYNALNFKNGQKLIDCNDQKIKWNKHSKQFKKLFWLLVIGIILTF